MQIQKYKIVNQNKLKRCSRLSSLQAEIKEWEPSKHFKDAEDYLYWKDSIKIEKDNN